MEMNINRQGTCHTKRATVLASEGQKQASSQWAKEQA